MKVAVLVKQIPQFSALQIGADGRLNRSGIDLEMNPYCRRAVTKGVELARETAGTCTVFTLGPLSAEAVLREAIAGGGTDGVLISGPEFAGSDTLATSRALAAALEVRGPFDAVLVGKNSVDGDTGQVGPGIAQLLGLPFVGPMRTLLHEGDVIRGEREDDNGISEVGVHLPAVISVAERLCQPCKRTADQCAEVDATRIIRFSAADLPTGFAYGAEGSPTSVGQTRSHAVSRRRLRIEGTVQGQVRHLAEILRSAGGRESTETAMPRTTTGPRQTTGPAVVVLVGADTASAVALLGAASALADQVGGHVIAIGPDLGSAAGLAGAGADRLVRLVPDEGLHCDLARSPEDVAAALAGWTTSFLPWAILVESTTFGREVAARVAAVLGAGLTGDAVSLEVVDGRLISWKPAFGGQLVAAIAAKSPVQMATIRPGVFAAPPMRDLATPVIEDYPAQLRGRVDVFASHHDDDPKALAAARTIVGVGRGVDPADIPGLQPLLKTLDAELGATRAVTDEHHVPRSRQIGITGRSVHPELYLAIGVSGRFNHMVGVRAAKLIVAINTDPAALIFDAADLGLVGDYRDIVPLLVAALASNDATVAS